MLDHQNHRSPLTRDGVSQWMKSFRERHGASPFEVLNCQDRTYFSDATIAEAWAAYYLQKNAIDTLFE